MGWLDWLLLPACLAGGLSLAQAETIYKSPGAQGPVYSDTPTPGGRAVDLPPPNIAQPPPKPAARPPTPVEEKNVPQPEAVSYRSLKITQPEDNGSVGDNTATFEVRVAVDPPPQYELGHAFLVKLNGRTVDKRFRSTEMMIPPEFFGDGVRANEWFHLEVSIVDRDGKVLATAPPVDFVMRHVWTRPELPPRTHPFRPDMR
jgi:hypothetical protein